MRRVLLGALLGLLAPLTLVAPAGGSAVAITHSPRAHQASTLRAAGWASSNWSGYAITSRPFTSITGTWVVPTVSGSKHGATYSSSWTGIDGFNNSDLIQAGTEQDFYNGRAHYYAWWEILPAAETRISSVAVRPGDRVTVSISKRASGWAINLTDSRTTSFTTTQSYFGPGTSAEWIEEAPSVGGRIARLAKYSTATFDPGTVNGSSPGLAAADGGVMIQRNAQVSTPSNPDHEADGFKVAYGSTAPSPPPR